MRILKEFDHAEISLPKATVNFAFKMVEENKKSDAS